jgi:hypothetical protein
MQMIRHHTKGVYDKVVPGGLSAEKIDNPSSFISCEQNRLAVFATRCDEEPLFADAFVQGLTDGSSV